MNIDRLGHFKLVADGAPLREAAELVGLSPGALSRSLKALEAELGVSLFRTVGKRLVLSEQGRATYPLIARLLEEYSAFRRALTTDAPPASRPVRYCSHSVFTTYFMGYTLEHHLPKEEVFVRNLAPGAIESSVAGMESDFGLTYAPVPTLGVEFVPVTRVPMAAFVRRGSFRGVPLEQIPCSVPLFRIDGARPLAMTVDAWPDDSPRESVRYHFDLLETALESCRQGLSWAYFPLFVAWLHNARVRPEYQLERLRVAKPPPKHTRAAFLVKRSGDEETPAMKRVCSALREVCKAGKAHFERDAH